MLLLVNVEIATRHLGSGAAVESFIVKWLPKNVDYTSGMATIAGMVGKVSLRAVVCFPSSSD